MIKLIDYPQLKLIAWNLHVEEITEQEALGLYELNWRFIDQNTLTLIESNLIDRLIHDYGNGVLNV